MIVLNYDDATVTIGMNNWIVWFRGPEVDKYEAAGEVIVLVTWYTGDFYCMHGILCLLNISVEMKYKLQGQTELNHINRQFAQFFADWFTAEQCECIGDLFSW